MIDQMKSKLEELENKKKELQPKIEEIKVKKIEEIGNLNKKYEHLILDASSEVGDFEREVNNDLINAFEQAALDEFDAKRSTSEYQITDNIKEFRDFCASVDMFPKELVNKLDNIITGDKPIENIVYDLDSIKKKYLKSG